MKKIKKIVLYAVVVIAVIGCAIVANNKLSPDKKDKPATVVAKKTSVQVQVAKTVEKDSSYIFKSTLEAYQQGTVSSKLSAKVIGVSIKNGQYVNKGDTLITLDDQDIRNNIKTEQGKLKVNEQQLNAVQVAMEKYKVNLNDAQRNYDRQKALLEKKIIAQTDLEVAEKVLNSAQADYDSGNASIETSKANMASEQITISNYQDNLNNTVIKAPISGVISDKAVSVGQMASLNATLAKVNDISSVYATIQIPQDKVNIATIGQAATITVEGSDKTYNGAVESMDLSADAISRVLNCKIKIDSNGDKSLLPGFYGKVNLSSDEKSKMITVPISALAGNEGNYSVLINDNGKAKKQKVTIGETNKNDIEITSGIKEGDQIICSNLSTLQNGSAIDAVSK
jgi:multidrug efflux pump subunit AcrA (membrane-fusion protein)